MSRVLVTDGEQRSSLAVVRSLGRAGHDVVVVSHHPRPLCAASRYVDAFHRVPDPTLDPAAFRDGVKGVVEAEHVGILIPMTDVTIPLLLDLRAEIPELVIPFPDQDVYEAISDKGLLMEVARGLGVPVPRQEVLRAAPSRDVTFQMPAVLKPARSAVRAGGGMRKQGVRMADTVAEATAALAGYGAEAYPILMQERIVGPGLGLFVLARNGEVLASFAHRRIREKPPTGGVSVYRESVGARPDLVEHAVRIMAHYRWTGVAMVEFKEDRSTGTPYLMEVNGRFWGSLQLAVDAGVDFPELLVRVAEGKDVPPIPGYRIGVRSRWLWGDVDHLLSVLRGPKGLRETHPELPTALGAVARFLVPWRPGDRFEVLRPDDPRPFLRESAEWFRALRK